MSEGARSTNLGTAGGSAINADATAMGHHQGVKVQLSASYTRSAPPGWPHPPGMTGAAAGSLDFPKTLNNGTQIVLHAPEANALIAAGKATFIANV